MANLVNDPLAFKEELIEGMVAAYSRYWQRVPNAAGVMAHGLPKKGYVSVINGGGSGHYPTFAGMVGEGMMSASVIGDIFTSPSGEQAYRVAKAVDGGAGILFCYGNYSGDVMNFDMAAMRLEDDGIDVDTVLITDDVASGGSKEREVRRGVAGGFYVYKCVGASAARGDDLATVKRIGEKASALVRTYGVAFAGCTLPGQSEPLFTVEKGKMELGMGIHGEPGVEVGNLRPAHEIGDLMLERILADTPDSAGNRVAVLVNTLGRTSPEELFVFYQSVHKKLQDDFEIYRPIVGQVVSSLDMAGCSLTLFWLDDELQELLEAHASTPAYTHTGG